MGTRTVGFLSGLAFCVAATDLSAGDQIPTPEEIEQKLSNSTQRLGGMLTFIDSFREQWSTATAYPLPIAWKIVCGSEGLKVVFGPQDAENATTIFLADGALNKSQCLALIPKVEEPVRRLTAVPTSIDISALKAP